MYFGIMALWTSPKMMVPLKFYGWFLFKMQLRKIIVLSLLVFFPPFI